MSRGTIEKANAAEKTTVKRLQTAYLSSPHYMDLSGIYKELESRGVRIIRPDELDLPGRNLSEMVRETLGRADLVLAVVDASAASNNVFFEVGFAQAMGKPTFVLLAGNASPSPWLSSGIPYFRFDPEKAAGLDFGISQILSAALHAGKTSSTPFKRSRPLGNQALDLLHQLHEAGDTIAPEQFEAILASAIRASGVASISEARGTESGFDFAVWSEDLSPWIGNPIAVKVRLEIRNKADLSLAVEQLAHAMARSDIPWSLLIYRMAAIDVTQLVCMPNVLILSGEQFLGGLQSVGFAELLRQLRNQRVHGNF